MRTTWFFAAVLLLLAIPAQGQEAIYRFGFTASQVNYISGLLGKQPYMEVRDIINSMQREINEQKKPMPQLYDSKGKPMEPAEKK